MKTKNYSQKSLGEIVSDDFRAAEIFKKAEIDFCCGGKKTLEEACREKNTEVLRLEEELTALEQIPANPGQNFKEWDLAFLTDYIVQTHHKYVLKSLPDLVFYTQKIASVHAENHPELIEVARLFGEVNRELLQHLKNEEEVLFPAIKALLNKHTHTQEQSTARATIHSEISRMSGEHEFAGGAMDHINEITGHYTFPEDGCNTYRVALQLLQQFEDDLHVHVHLENNILYPKALAL